MPRARLPLLATLLLAACASSPARLDGAWRDFERRQGACLERAETVLREPAALLRARGDEDELARIAMPEGHPIARLAWITFAASLAYVNADLAGLEEASAALDRCERDLDALELPGGARGPCR